MKVCYWHQHSQECGDIHCEARNNVASCQNRTGLVAVQTADATMTKIFHNIAQSADITFTQYTDSQKRAFSHFFVVAALDGWTLLSDKRCS